jgi:hypothetical protein
MEQIWEHFPQNRQKRSYFRADIQKKQNPESLINQRFQGSYARQGSNLRPSESEINRIIIILALLPIFHNIFMPANLHEEALVLKNFPL